MQNRAAPGRPSSLVVRDAQARDAAAIVEIYAPFVRDNAVSFETELPSVTEMVRRIAEYQRFAPWLVAELSGAVVGYAYASRHRERAAYRWAVETSVYVGASCRGRGVGRELYSELFVHLRSQGFTICLAGIALPNEVSVAFHESIGFLLIGTYPAIGFKLGRWHDVGWWQKSLGENRETAGTHTPPREPAPPAL